MADEDNASVVSTKSLPYGVEEEMLYNGPENRDLRMLAWAFNQTPARRWVSGVLPALDEELRVFFLGKDDEGRSLNYPYSQDRLRDLTNACQKATFGMGTKDVLDESYRTAWKLDFGRFSWVMRLEEIATVLLSNLMPRSQTDTLGQVKFELYKLNVYGEGAFFKSHKDTPRRTDMFGSLVFILPSPHSGGELVLRHKEDEYTFDAAASLRELSNHIAYCAFYSDVDHEVCKVTEGHRVSITYNLYWDTKEPIRDAGLYPPVEETPPWVHTVLASLLSKEDFLPSGGMLGFALQHQYPVEIQREVDVSTMSLPLKGLDRILAHTCQSLGLSYAPRVVYYDRRSDAVILTRVVVEWDDLYEDTIFSRLVPRNRKGIRPATLSYMDKEFTRGDRELQPVHWITEPKSSLYDIQSVEAHGNEPTTEIIYARFAIIVGVGPAGNRSEFGELPPSDAPAADGI